VLYVTFAELELIVIVAEVAEQLRLLDTLALTLTVEVFCVTLAVPATEQLLKALITV
jgi:hypothetical protein